MSRVLCIGDPHFRVKNIADVNLYIANITVLAQKLQPDFIVCHGDLLHEHEKIHTLILNKAYEFLRAMIAVAPTFLLVGNHDMINASQFLSPHHWMGGLKEWKGLTVVDQIVCYRPLKSNPEKTGARWTGETFYMAPYVPPGRFVEALNTPVIDISTSVSPPESLPTPEWLSATAIFGHQEFKGCKMGALISEIGDPWPLDYPLCIMGHIHDKQMPQSNILYVGSSAQHGYGETGDKTVALVTFKKTETKSEEPSPRDEWTFSLEEFDLGLPKRTILTFSVLEAQAFLSTSLGELTEYTKLKISGTYAEIKAFRDSKLHQEVLKRGAKISFKHEERQVKSHSELTRDRLSGAVKVKDFSGILADLVAAEKSSLLSTLHQELLVKKRAPN